MRIPIVLLLLTLFLLPKTSDGQSRFKGGGVNLYINQELMQPQDTINYEWVQSPDSIFQISYQIPENLLPKLKKYDASFKLYLIRDGASLRYIALPVTEITRSFNIWKLVKDSERGDVIAVELGPSGGLLRYYQQIVLE